MSTYVLVHGAFGGAHGFRRVRPLLRAAGHDVFTPSLTGIGERVHLSSPQVDLTTHVQDVVNCIVYEDLSGIVLLGYSYGGFVVAGALEHVGDRVAHIVFLDAFVPGDGDSAASLVGEEPPTRSSIGTLGDDWLVPPAPRTFEPQVDEAWENARRTPQPGASFAEAVRLPVPLESWPFTRTYIKATAEGEAGDPMWKAAERAKASPAWRYQEIATNHMIPQNRPGELANLLLELA